MSLTKERREEIESEIIKSIGIKEKVPITQKSLASKCGVSVQSVSRIIQNMEKAGRIIKNKEGRINFYTLPKNIETYKYKLEGLVEDIVYKKIAVNFIQGVPKCARDSFVYAFLEILNNAIEHSGGTEVEIRLFRNESCLMFLITDDGVGIFTKIANELKLEEKSYAILELAKGKFTTEPESHTGEGIFFSSKCGDMFGLSSDGIGFATDSEVEMLCEPPNKSLTIGTEVCFKVNMWRTQTLEELFQQYTDAPESYGFSKTLIPIRLLEYGDKTPVFISRSQARRLLVRVERFKAVMLDFSGIDTIGQGFADEVFRVFKTNHPDVELIPINCSAAVDKMIRHILEYR